MLHRPYHKILWSEGMLVGPHHFQQADHYHEAMLDFRARPMVPFGWGALTLEVNRDLLENSGIFQIESFRGILPSGTVLNIPEGDEAPETREVFSEHFMPPSNRMAVYLALPLAQPNLPTVAEPSQNGYGSGSRYVTDFVEISDDSGRDNAQEIVTTVKNVKLLFEHEPSHNLERFKVAELIRHEDGRITLVADFIPACLLISASAPLQRLLQNLQAELLTKATMLSSALTQRTSEQYTLSDADADTVWAINLLNGAVPLLTHFCQIEQIHPQVVYQNLLQLAGQLTTLAVRMGVSDLPRYDHEDLGKTFSLLIDTIRRLLYLVVKPISNKYVTYGMIPATTERGYAVLRTQYEIEPRLLTSAHQFYLVIRAEAIESRRQGELTQILPDTLTIAGFPAIDEFIEFAYGVYVAATPPPGSTPQLPSRQLPGLSVPIPPDDMPTRSGAIYCALRHEGPAWKTIQTTQMLAVHMPPEFRREFKVVEIELVITGGSEHE